MDTRLIRSVVFLAIASAAIWLCAPVAAAQTDHPQAPNEFAPFQPQGMYAGVHPPANENGRTKPQPIHTVDFDIPRTADASASFSNYSVQAEPLTDYGRTPFSPFEGPVLPTSLPSQKISTYKSGFFQKASATTTYIPRSSTGLGVTEFQVFTTVAVPAPTRNWPMLITPSFFLRLFDGPTNPDVPSSVYDAYLEFMWVPRISPRWQAIVSVAPGVYTNFESYSSNAFRLTGRGLARFQWKPDVFEIVFGVLYLNRLDVQILPAGGVIWQPADDVRMELIFPKPKIAGRFRVGHGFEDWVYVGGEFGGETWSVQRTTGVEERLTMRDWRVMLGVERKRNGGAGLRLEVGYVFSRQLKYEFTPTEFKFSDSLLVRGGITF